MRDPERIPLLLATLERAWRRHPDLRFGQVVNLACRSAELDVKMLVLIEDDDFLEGAEKLEHYFAAGLPAEESESE